MENKRILSPSKRYKRAESEDLSLKINLERDESILREGDRTIILDLEELYSKERNESTKYKIYGKLGMVFRNLNAGTSGYNPLLNRLYLTSAVYDETDYSGYVPYDEFAFLRKDYVRETSNPTTNTIGQFTPNIVLSGDTSHQTFTQMDAPFMNWNLYLTYVYENDYTYPMRYTLSGNTVYNFTAECGIPFRVTELDTYFQLVSPVPHNMSQSEYVILSGSTLNENNRTGRIFEINSVGNETFNSEKYVINLQKSQLTQNQITIISNIGVVFGQRCLDKNNVSGTTSQYYVRKHKTITTTDDYILDTPGFEIPIFENERKLQFITANGDENVYVEQNRPEKVLYHFKNSIDISQYRNNFGYTPTELYLTTIFRNGNGYFNYPPRMGWRFNFHDSWGDAQFDTTYSYGSTNLPSTTFTNNGVTFTKGLELPLDTILYGDFVEYNQSDFKETVISDTYHKFSFNPNAFDHGQTSDSNYSGSSNNNPYGYFHKVHNRIKLRELSPYVETSDTENILNLPENTIYDENIGLWKWRDLYDHGYIDVDGYGTDFPFTNGQHYVMNDINFFLRGEDIFKNKADGITSFRGGPKDSLC